jgi:RNA polymerase sigma-70 factor (ECF subfamily)
MSASTNEQVWIAGGWSDTPTVLKPAAVDIAELFVQCERPLGKFLVQMVGDRTLAEDLLQDVFHDAVRGQQALAAAASPSAWLFGIARNHALSAVRRQRRFRRAVELLGRRRDSDAGEFEREFVAVRDLLERHLGPDDRALVLLRYLHGFDACELARMTGLSPVAVRQRLTRARRALLAAQQSSPRDPDKGEQR